MASGMKTMRINTQERAISPDINRLQAFKGKDHGELWRYLLDVIEEPDVTPGVITENATIGTPLRGEVINGVMVEPQLGNLDLYVRPGVLFLLQPEAPLSSDDSAYKFVRTDGVLTPGALSITPNSTGQTRIDWIECRYVETTVETDNRDIFNPTTGLFTAQTVTKATEGRLEFRVRAGTPGAGLGTPALGWFPLAVASVPAATTTNNTVTFWDLRRLAADRVRAASDTQNAIPYWGDMAMRFSSTEGLSGYCRVGIDGRWSGGTIRRGTPGPESATGVPLSECGEGAGVPLAPGGLVYFYLIKPFGLKWTRYTEAGSGFRRPRGCSGILVASTTGTDTVGRPSAPVTLPAACGFVSAASSIGVAIGCAPVNAFSNVTPFLVENRRVTWLSDAYSGGAAIANTATPGAGSWFSGLANPGQHFPACAVGLHLRRSVEVTNAKNAVTVTIQAMSLTLSLSQTEGGTDPVARDEQTGITMVLSGSSASPDPILVTRSCWLPLRTRWPLTNRPVGGYRVFVGSPWGYRNITPNATDVSFAAQAGVFGYEF